jgi:hypothetical protein
MFLFESETTQQSYPYPKRGTVALSEKQCSLSPILSPNHGWEGGEHTLLGAVNPFADTAFLIVRARAQVTDQCCLEAHGS